MTIRRPHRNSPARIKRRDHQRIWRMVEGAVVDAFQQHPDYLTVKGQAAAVESVTKRVVGVIVGSIQGAQVAAGETALESRVVQARDY